MGSYGCNYGPRILTLPAHILILLLLLAFSPRGTRILQPGEAGTRSPSTAGTSVTWAYAGPTAWRSYNGFALPSPRSPQGRPAASPRTPTAMGAAGGARRKPGSVPRTPACSEGASAVPSSLGDLGHGSSPPRLQFAYPYIGPSTARFFSPNSSP
ncbi:putative adrenomedullin-5-like protein isoform X1 [Rhinopithecus roxellana]|uniref:putative adrenomedullin-5-like protein isoform X1 n=1 Tax=Rhinopithecus roxellana TaxID=61622 RepID=UPI0012373FB4|nr:putative adrenomedullin-5-like protein isoform X1 [Rhinopithecus roxellana]